MSNSVFYHSIQQATNKSAVSNFYCFIQRRSVERGEEEPVPGSKSAPGRVRLRHLAEGRMEVRRRQQQLGRNDGRYAARHRLHPARLTHIRLLRRRITSWPARRDSMRPRPVLLLGRARAGCLHCRTSPAPTSTTLFHTSRRRRRRTWTGSRRTRWPRRRSRWFWGATGADCGIRFSLHEAGHAGRTRARRLIQRESRSLSFRMKGS